TCVSLNTDQHVFYPRRIADPEFGGRLTGKKGPWALGVLASDDRAPGERLPVTDPDWGKRALIGAFRLQREVGSQSTIGVLATTRDFGSGFDRIFALDGRFKLSPNWVLTGQAIRSFDRSPGAHHLSGSDYLVNLARSGQHFVYDSTYLDRSPNFTAPLGFIQRVDIRQASQHGGYYWKRDDGPVVAFGPSVTVSSVSNHRGVLQDWSALADFTVSLRAATEFHVARAEYYELFQLQHLRQHGSTISFYTGALRWIGVSGLYNQGAAANYSPPAGLAPFVGNAKDASVGITIRPLPRLRFDQTYLFTHLTARPGSSVRTGSTRHIFDN